MQRIVHRTFADKVNNDNGNNKEVTTVDTNENSLASNDPQKSDLATKSDEQELIAINFDVIKREEFFFQVFKKFALVDLTT